MKANQAPFRSELEISPEWVMLFPVVLGTTVLYAVTLSLDLDLRLWMQITGVSVCLTGLLSWALTHWRVWLGKVFDLGLVAAAIVLFAVRFDAPAVLVLLVVPTGAAALLLNLPAAAGFASVETLLLLVGLVARVPGFEGLTAVMTFLVLWAVVGLLALAFRPVGRMTRWSWHFYQEALRLREDAFARREDLEQTLENLANANRQLALASRRMADLRTLAEEEHKTKAMFLAKVSHEFRTPLNMIIGLVELMVASPHIYAVDLPPDMENDLAVVLRNSRHLSSMIDDVLDLTRVESGRVMLHRERVCLPEIIAEAVTAVRPLIEKKGLALRVSVPDDAPDIYCDRTRIRQVVLNLVSNAARFTEAGEIAVRVHVLDGYLVTQVQDTGPGISAEDIARIFEPFSPVSGSLWRDKGGTGLGLSISQQFVALHQGKLWVESEPGVGSSFNFRLPISQPLEPIARPGHHNREDWIWREAAFRTERAGVAGQVRKPRVTVRDEVGGLYPELLRYAGEVDLAVAEDWAGHAAGGACASTAGPAPLPGSMDILMLNAPPGAEPAGALAALEHLPAGTLVVQCAVPVFAAQAASAGAAGYLNKPVSSETLREVIRDLACPVQRIMVVDDDPDLLRLFARLLKLIVPSVVVETEERAVTALDRVRAEPFDLVLLDLLMPDMDGWAWLEQARQDPRLADVPIYLVSAQDPADEPPASTYLLVTTAGGISIKRLLRCSLELSRLFLTPEGELDPEPPPGSRGEWV